jgi:hypothetical protein
LNSIIFDKLAHLVTVLVVAASKFAEDSPSNRIKEYFVDKDAR